MGAGGLPRIQKFWVSFVLSYVFFLYNILGAGVEFLRYFLESFGLVLRQFWTLGRERGGGVVWLNIIQSFGGVLS